MELNGFEAHAQRGCYTMPKTTGTHVAGSFRKNSPTGNARWKYKIFRNVRSTLGIWCSGQRGPELEVFSIQDSLFGKLSYECVNN